MDAEPRSPAIEREPLLAALTAALPAGALLHEPEALAPYECDGLSAYRQRPLCVCMPYTVEQVQEVLRVCRSVGVPVVARGAGTGLSGGALPLAGGVLLSLARFNRILEVDPRNRVARVEPGVRNLAVSEAVAAYGLFYAPDPSSQIACSIGGNVAENAGGVHCLKYGLTVHNVLALRVLTMDGDLLEIGGVAPDAPGYDLMALLTGSEGLLGVIVEVTVKLLPIPEAKRVVLGAFASTTDAAAAVGAIIAAGIVPAGLEFMDRAAIQAVSRYVAAGYPADAEAILLCELDGSEAELADTVPQLRDCLTAHAATRIEVAVDPADQKRMWAGRKAAFPAMGRLAPDYYCMDGTIPRQTLPRVLAQIAAWSEQYDLPVANVFHAGDGNLHPLILYDANKPGELARVEELGELILELCIAVGGTITGEHGVGVEKLNPMCVQFTTAELERFHGIKRAFDPQELLNPGKAIPALRRCAELGRMHVHRGQLPFPELERF